ncbi:hypothetical protein [Streptomyces laurentii]|uniref:hypothetical protein n=1 Tax=Streptomyces laurentii TaxID=39478 RepID=UPI0034114B74
MDRLEADTDSTDEPAEDQDDLEGHRGDTTAEPQSRKWRPFLALGTAACVLVASELTWLFWDDLMYPLGDPRACAGSDTALPDVIVAGGARLPSDATQVRYYTYEGQAVVSFVSDQVPGYLVRAHLIPDTAPPVLDREHGSAYGLGPDDSDLPEGLCGEGIRGPAWIFDLPMPPDTAGLPGVPSPGTVLVEVSADGHDALRTPARVQLTFPLVTAED